MALPTRNDVIIRGALQNVSIMYRNASFIGSQVFPTITGLNSRTQILKYAKGPWFRLEAALRAEGTVAERGSYSVSTTNIDPKQVSIGKAVTDELVRSSSEPGNLPLQPITEAIEYCANQIDLYNEKLIADAIFAQTWADGVAHGTDMHGAWATQTTASTLISDIRAGKSAVQAATGLEPNTLLMDYATWVKILDNALILDRIKYSQAGVTTEQIVAMVLGLDRVLVGKALINSAKEHNGEATFTPKQLWEYNTGKGSAFLYYTPASAGLRTPAAGYKYQLNIDGAAREVRSYREDPERQMVYEVTEESQISCLGLDLGYLYKDCISD
jgi:hypothetical protein